IFVHGCFWHQHPGCRDATRPKTRLAFWAEKFTENRLRDERQIAALLAAHWRGLVVWGGALQSANGRSSALIQAVRWVRSRSRYREIARPMAGLITQRAR